MSGISAVASTAGVKALAAAEVTFDTTCAIITEPSALEKVMKIALCCLEAVSHAFKQEALPILSRILTACLDVTGVLDTIPDAITFFTTPFKKKNACKLAGSALLLSADIGGVVLFLDDIKVLELGRIAMNIGRSPVTQQAVKTALGTVVKSIVGVAFAFFAVDAAIHLATAKNKTQRIKSLLELAWCVSEVALKAFTLFAPAIFTAVGLAAAVPVASIAGPIALGLIAAGLGLAAFIYTYTHKKELEAEPKHNPSDGSAAAAA